MQTRISVWLVIPTAVSPEASPGLSTQQRLITPVRTMKKGQVQVETGRGLGCRGPMGSRGLGRWLLWFMGFVSLSPFFSCHVFQVLMAVLCPTPPNTALLPPEPPASHLADSAGLSSHKAEEPRPERCEAAAAGEEIHHHTECLNPSSRGLVHLSRSC